jgi:hypothetical protein
MFKQKKTNKISIRLINRLLLGLFLFAILFGPLNINKADADNFNEDTIANIQQRLRQVQRELDELNTHTSHSPEELKKIDKLNEKIRAFEQIISKNRIEEARQREEEEAEATNHCIYYTGLAKLHTNIGVCIQEVLVGIGQATIWIGVRLLRLTNYLFAASLKVSVVDLHKYASMKSVEIAWMTLRDLMNMFFVVILLYAAISAVLNLPNKWKKTVANVIIVALLINFSIVVPKIVIDASNVLTLQAYNNFGEPMTTEQPDVRDIGKTITSILKELIQGFAGINNINVTTEGSDPFKITIPSAPTNRMAIIVALFGATILFLIMSFVLASGAIMFLARAVTLIILIIFSPIIFFAWMIPYFQKYAKRWINSLVSQSIFAPAFLIPFMLVIAIIKDFANFVSAPQNKIVAPETQYNPILNSLVLFILINGLIVYTLKIAKELGAYGADRADSLLTSAGKTARNIAYGSTIGLGLKGAGFAAREFLGRLGRAIAEGGGGMDEDFKAKHPIRSQLNQALYDFASNFRFGLKESYGERIDRLAGESAKFKKAENEVAYLSTAPEAVVKKRLESMDAETLASRAYEAKRQGLTKLAKQMEDEAKRRGSNFYDEFLSKSANERAKNAIKTEDTILENGEKISIKDTKKGLAGTQKDRETTLNAITEKASNKDLFSASQAGQLHKALDGIENEADAAAVIRATLIGLARRKDGKEALEQYIKSAKTAEHRALIATELDKLSNDSGMTDPEKERLRHVRKTQKDLLKITDGTVPKGTLDELTAMQNGKEPLDDDKVKKLIGDLSPQQIVQLPAEILTDGRFIKHIDGTTASKILASDKISQNIKKRFIMEIAKLPDTDARLLKNHLKASPSWWGTYYKECYDNLHAKTK